MDRVGMLPARPAPQPDPRDVDLSWGLYVHGQAQGRAECLLAASVLEAECRLVEIGLQVLPRYGMAMGVPQPAAHLGEHLADSRVSVCVPRTGVGPVTQGSQAGGDQGMCGCDDGSDGHVIAEKALQCPVLDLIQDAEARPAPAWLPVGIGGVLHSDRHGHIASGIAMSADQDDIHGDDAAERALVRVDQAGTEPLQQVERGLIAQALLLGESTGRQAHGMRGDRRRGREPRR